MSLLKNLNENIQNCTRCELCRLEVNKKDISKGFGKLYGWKGGNKNCRFLFLGMNPSHRRFSNHEYAFGGINGSPGPGEDFNRLLREIGILDEIFIDNVCHCSSLTNEIKLEWAQECFDFILKEIEILKPLKIITMGKQVFDIAQKLLADTSNKIDINNIWHPSYVFSYQRVTPIKYKHMIIQACKERNI
jgi:uracil-DNA glycosylase family 4